MLLEMKFKVAWISQQEGHSNLGAMFWEHMRPNCGKCWHQIYREGGGCSHWGRGWEAWAMGRAERGAQGSGAEGWGRPHLSLLHLCAPLVMVKPPVSSCWMCMAKSRAAGRVGWALKRRPSIRHRLSLFRKTWCPASGWGRGGGIGQRSGFVLSWGPLSAADPRWRPRSQSGASQHPT